MLVHPAQGSDMPGKRPPDVFSRRRMDTCQEPSKPLTLVEWRWRRPLVTCTSARMASGVGGLVWKLGTPWLMDLVRKTSMWLCSPRILTFLCSPSVAVYDWSATKDLIEHGFTKGLEVNPQEHPVLVTEPAWNTTANRERMAEIMFEEFQVPAFYIANSSVLSAYVLHDTFTAVYLGPSHELKSSYSLMYRFASGKGTALIIDIGKSQANVTPVVDGFVLRKGVLVGVPGLHRPCLGCC